VVIVIEVPKLEEPKKDVVVITNRLFPNLRFVIHILTHLLLLKPVAGIQPDGIEIQWPHEPALADSVGVADDAQWITSAYKKGNARQGMSASGMATTY
jgi:hypothetical protein